MQKILPNPTKNQRKEMKTKTHPLRRSFLLATLAFTFLLPTVHAAELVEGKRYEVCLRVLDKINATPDFFSRLDKEGYAYILFHSPFKRQEIQKIPTYITYPLLLEEQALSKQSVSHSLMQHAKACNNYPENAKACEKYVAKRMSVLFKDTRNQWARDSFFDNSVGFAYKAASNLLSNSKIEEAIIGIVGYNNDIHKKNKKNTEPYALVFIVDRYMRLHPDIYLYKKSNKNGAVFPYGSAKDLSIEGIPIDIDSRTFILTALYNKAKGFVYSIWISEYNMHYSFISIVVDRSYICIINK